MMLLKDKHAVIYGGAGSIGGAIARVFAAAGAGDAATFLASDRASAMTATLANVTCGAFLD
jgi:NAD(P)-dependent dehydrogenase (short-subunit alcohol dehydrogenase family)